LPKDLSVILVWLDGGPPQHETYDPKPDAPVEFRGPLRAMSTCVPGIQISEVLPCHARLMDRMTIIRSMHHNTGDHFTGAHWMLTGYGGPSGANTNPRNPSMGSIIAKLRGARAPDIPPYVSLPTTHSVGLVPGYHGASYLGVAHNPFAADGDPNSESYQVPNLSLPAEVTSGRASSRQTLLNTLDQIPRDVDASGLIDGFDRFHQDAFDLVTSPAARAAFDISREEPRLRDRYGRHTWGQSALTARRLIEAGVRFVTLVFSGWDLHSSLERATRANLPIVDNAVGSLVEDLELRGMLDSTLVIVMGEFGRTPRMNKTGVPGADPIPGRDHWGKVMSVLLAGGGVPGGQLIGASNSRGEVPRDRPVRPQDLIVTLYQRLGIDPQTSFLDRAGRPISIGSTGQPIAELG
jgi:hypothetical protein